jgi:hypothetical protein
MQTIRYHRDSVNPLWSSVRRRAVAGAFLAAWLVPLAGCSKGDTAPPVATVSLSTNKDRVALGGPIDLTYRFVVAPDAKIDGDYRVFVHVEDADGKIMWDDDHDPPIPTSQWKPGQTIEYTRTRFVPVVRFGEATIEVGLYRDSDRLPLEGPDPADRESASRGYRVATIQLLPQSENIFLIYRSGWHPVEFSAENPTIEWQWTQKAAELSLRNPRRDVTFYLEFDTRTDAFPDHPQQVTVYCNGQPIKTLAADSSATRLERIPIDAATLGTNEMVELRIEVDPAFVPAKLPSGGRDSRELGIRVYHVFVEPR